MSSDKNTPLTNEEISVSIKVLEGMKEKSIDSYMLISTSYVDLIYPFDEGLKVVEAMKHAKTYTHNYDKAPKISELGNHNVRILSEAEVLAIHTAEILGIEDRDEWSNLRDEITKTYPNLRTKDST